ncbi:MAG: hypothetical protein COC12_02650 [Rhodobacteraceae bacterium]|nr:MAG: hypothetical protein COC12_02650 [Paracoccaceae bacterium]
MLRLWCQNFDQTGMSQRASTNANGQNQAMDHRRTCPVFSWFILGGGVGALQAPCCHCQWFGPFALI